MTVRKAIEHFKEHQRTSLKRRTQEGYRNLLERFQSEFCEREVESIKAEELCRFLETCTEGLAKSTRRLRYAQLRAVFNFIIDTFEMNIKNPCCVPQLFKSFKNVQQRPRKILDKETVDEIIFNSASARDRLILELQARCGLRTEEVGGTRSLRIVEVISPPRITIAMGPSISRPAVLLPMAKGKPDARKYHIWNESMQGVTYMSAFSPPESVLSSDIEGKRHI